MTEYKLRLYTASTRRWLLGWGVLLSFVVAAVIDDALTLLADFP